MARRESGSRREASASVAGAQLLLLLSVLALFLIGLVMVYSASSVKAINDGGTAASYLFDQVKYAVIGIAAAFVLWKFVPCEVWDRSAVIWAVWGVAILLLLLVAFKGTEIYGARRWLSLGPVGFQPSEFVKVAFVLVSAHVFNNFRLGRASNALCLVQALVVFLPLLFLLKTQSDLGTTLICAVGILAVVWLGEAPLRPILIVLAVGLVFVVCSIAFTDYRSGRMVYLDPWNDGKDGYGDGYNIIRSYYALAEGGLFGVGLGNSHEKYLYLFASESDFIFAVIGEELGMVGALAVIGLFLILLYAGMQIARAASDDFGTMVAGGCTVVIVFQAFLNIGCVIGVLPTTGKPLPFISAGGSSLVATFLMVGFILSVAHGAGKSVYDRRREDLRVLREVRHDSDAPRNAAGFCRLAERLRAKNGPKCVGWRQDVGRAKEEQPIIPARENGHSASFAGDGLCLLTWGRFWRGVAAADGPRAFDGVAFRNEAFAGATRFVARR